jgi:hypothetical protein
MTELGWTVGDPTSEPRPAPNGLQRLDSPSLERARQYKERMNAQSRDPRDVLGEDNAN